MEKLTGNAGLGKGIAMDEAKGEAHLSRVRARLGGGDVEPPAGRRGGATL